MKPDRPADRMMVCLKMALDHARARVLAVLAFHDGPGGASPSAATLADGASMTRSAVFKHLAALESLGVLIRRKGKTTNSYAINYAWPAATLSPSAGQSTQCPLQGDSEPGERGEAGRQTVPFSASRLSPSAGQEPEEPETNLRARATPGDNSASRDDAVLLAHYQKSLGKLERDGEAEHPHAARVRARIAELTAKVTGTTGNDDE